MEIIEKNLQEKKEESFTRLLQYCHAEQEQDAVVSSVAIQIQTCLFLLGKGIRPATQHPQIYQRQTRNLRVITSNADCQNKTVKFSAAPASILKMQLQILLPVSSLSFLRSRLLYQSSYCRSLSCSQVLQVLYRVTQPTAKPGRVHRP